MMSYLGGGNRRIGLRIASVVTAPGVWARGMVRRQPRRTALVLSLLLVMGMGIGLILYAYHQWHAAQAAVKEGRLEDSRAPLEFCLRVWPRSVPVHLLAARAARLKGEYVKAEGHLNKCLQLSREATEAVQLENLLMRGQRGEVDEVAADLMRLVDSKHPESPLILETISRAYVNHLRFGPALVYLERWIQEAPHSADAYFWRGWSLERLDYLERAFADIQRAVDLAPDRVLFRLQLADMYLERNYTPQALPHLESLRKQCPEIATIQARLGYCRFVLGQEQEGRGLLEAALEKRPDDPALLLYLARVELQEGRFQEAEKWAGRLMQLDPHNQEAQATLVNSLRLQGRQKEAAAAQAQYEKILALWHLSNELLMQETEHPGRDHNRTAEIGRTLLDLGQEPQGLYWLGQALKRDPGHQLAHRVLADYFQKKGDREKAAAHRRWLGGSLR